MMSVTSNVVTTVLLIAIVLVIEVICRDASNLMRGDSTNTRNAWGPQFQANSSAVFLTNEKTSTPWPELGAKRNNNRAQQQNPARNPTWVRPPASPAPPAPNSAPKTSNKPNPSINSGPQLTSGNTGAGAGATNEDDELREFSETLLKKDVNNAAKYVTVNFQGRTTSRSEKDEAPQPLMTIEKDALAISTVEKLVALYNNYILESNQNEHYTAQEKTEESNLLDAVLATSIMQHTRNFLIEKGKLGRDPKQFKDVLREIWFNMYARGGGRIGSSGFEHVFLAEIKNKQISGLHNWVYFNEEEKKNEANYLGYMKKLDLGNKGAILKYHFKFHGIDKPVGSMFIGTSPELEMALYTTCFLLRADQVCPLKMNNNRFVIRTYSYRYRGKNMIGSAFPEI